MTEFQEFPKMPRLSRECVVTEKLDGTNAQILIGEDGSMQFGSRTRWITPEDDNYGFAKWATANADELRNLGPGRHFGEWWGAGIQRRYGLEDKHFSLFNVGRWHDADSVTAGEDIEGRTLAPACCHVVPLLLRGMFRTDAIEAALALLKERGSYAAPGFMKPEGVIVYHVAGGFGFKKTLEKDEVPKTVAARQGA